MRILRILPLELALMAAFAAGPVQADDRLFTPLSTDHALHQAPSLDPSLQHLVNDHATASVQLVEAHADLVTARTPLLHLHLAPKVELEAHLVESSVSPSGNLIWYGVVAEIGSHSHDLVEILHFDPINTVTLVRSGDEVIGNVHFDDRWFKIRPLRTGGHAIIEVDPAGLPPDHPAEAYQHLPKTRMQGTSGAAIPGAATGTLTNTVIRVMVNYTPAAVNAVGDISGLIDLAVAESNEGYAHSGVLINLVLANKSLVSYTESSSFNTDLSRYRGTADGSMDSVHTTRNSSAADVAVLLINNASSCGLASTIGSAASTAFAVTNWDCATGYYSFAHEIGHLQGARHDPATDAATSPYSHGHGYRSTGHPDWRTIMAYDCPGGCPRLNYWSNPAITYRGQPMGIAHQSDNARVLNATRHTVAAFR